jgi:hypothetical protein
MVPVVVPIHADDFPSAGQVPITNGR